MSILTKYLEKLGISDPKDLSVEERQVYDNYKRILSTGEVSVQTIKDFCENQIGVIEGKWRTQYGDKSKDLIPFHTCYKLILNALDAPQKEREALEKHLNQLTNT